MQAKRREIDIEKESQVCKNLPQSIKYQKLASCMTPSTATDLDVHLTDLCFVVYRMHWRKRKSFEMQRCCASNILLRSLRKLSSTSKPCLRYLLGRSKADALHSHHAACPEPAVTLQDLAAVQASATNLQSSSGAHTQALQQKQAEVWLAPCLLYHRH